MKRSGGSESMPKRMRFSSYTQRITSFPPNAVPESYFHLGQQKYIYVSDFANVVRVHIRQYQMDDAGLLTPTKHGITMTPFLWYHFAQEMNDITVPLRPGTVNVVRDCLMLAKDYIDGEVYVTLQKYFQRADCARSFTPNLIMLSGEEWTELLQRREAIDSNIICMIGTVFSTLAKLEVSKGHYSVPAVSCMDAEMTMTTSLTELLKVHIEKNITLVFECYGCDQQYGNQLGHECVTYNHETRLSHYGKLAVFNIDIKEFVSDFMQKNNMFCYYLTDVFLSQLDFNCLVQSAKDLYIACDTNLYSAY